MDQAELNNYFTYHAPTEDQVTLYNQIRESALAFAEIICGCTPPGADQTAAIRKVREAVMTANAALACCPVKVTVEQVADQITFKSYYLGERLSSHTTTTHELAAIGEVHKALQGFYEMSARACGHGQRPEVFQYATGMAVDVHASKFVGLSFQRKE